MRRGILPVMTILALVFVLSGCSTTGHFKIPRDAKLMVTDRTVAVQEDGSWKTSPFFWNTAGGARYRLYDENGKLIRSGKLKTGFRAASIFWPPFAIIYWPMGLKGQYDLTVPGDGYTVVDDSGPNATLATEVASPEPIVPAKAKKKRNK